MATVAFIGLGIMGRPMAVNLVKAGFDVRGFSRTGRSRDAAAAQGVPIVGSLDAAVADADVVITMLPDTPDVEAVALGDGGALAGMRRGALYIDMSTIDPEGALRVHDAAARAGIGCLDAPVSGGEVASIEGTLSIMAGGTREDFDAARELFYAIGASAILVGGAGSGQVVKAANQLMVAGHLQMLAEAIVLLKAHDVDERGALAVLGAGLAGSTVLARKQNAILEQDYRPGFRVELHNKDLAIVQNAARRKGVALPATALVSQFMQALVAQGYGALDHSALYLLADELNTRRAEAMV
ncbi:2-hydroxy-3-oxopropionate reductase [Pseudolysinimonas kribbensis]|uniref:2-hydroxy-3-oxopropionate reductase n=1 Tax=Pseudolysinimonas kribbensis TaxID=433641 RepID=A0ABQ6K5L2_9MICO|nr:NAD(P)-dependent oxidoreductase [Pseudolysinimonas kribbensis]GMA94719.1 2-hydroxy-3-oxopropionate reductase [Pseudolysinimonas kribbensis]